MKSKSLKARLTSLFSNKSFLIPFSILCSFIIWIIITVNQNPTREQVFTDVHAVISLENTAASEMGLGIVSDLSDQKYTVTVSGPNYIVSALKPEDFKITADVTNINSAGTYNLKLIGTRNSGKSGYNFVSIYPESVEVTFDYIDTKDFNVVPKLIGVSAAEGLVAETPIPANSEQSVLTIKGPRSIMSKIASVGSVAEVNKTLKATQSFDSYIVLYDSDGKILYRYTLDGKVFDADDNEVLDRRLTLDFTSLKVTQPISKKKSVSVTPTFSSVPSGIDPMQFSPQVNITNVTVIGTPEVVDKMTTLNLSPIDFKNIGAGNCSFEISPNLPEGVKLVDSIEYFIVSLDTSKFLEKTVTVSNIKFSNIGRGLDAKSNSPIKNVKICGPIEVVSSINEQDFYAKVDLADKAEGDYTVDAEIVAGKYSNVWVFGNYTVSVTIK